MASNSDIGAYSPVKEAGRIFSQLCDQAEWFSLPPEVVEGKDAVSFYSPYDQIYYPIPFKETETLAALKGVEGAVAGAIADLRYGQSPQKRNVKISLERATAFGCQAYMAKVDGLSKLDPAVKAKLKGLEIRTMPFGELANCALRYRYGSAGSSVKWLSSDVCESIQD